MCERKCEKSSVCHSAHVSRPWQQGSWTASMMCIRQTAPDMLFIWSMRLLTPQFRTLEGGNKEPLRAASIQPVLYCNCLSVHCSVFTVRRRAWQETTARDGLHRHPVFHSGVIGGGVCILSKAKIVDVYFHAWSLNGYIHKIQHGDWFGGKGVGLCTVLYHGLKINLYVTHVSSQSY